ncbi:MAG TPA: Gfo/Idh/MocA family oxidoreductase [Clostridiales bacterium]|nr:Gfo/Idh/MocA family oxidoreductase [Clostridiales bacterium]
MLENDDIHLVSICSGMRCRQGDDIIKALKAHKHVYAEKPCVMDVEQLDAILKN